MLIAVIAFCAVFMMCGLVVGFAIDDDADSDKVPSMVDSGN